MLLSQAKTTSRFERQQAIETPEPSQIAFCSSLIQSMIATGITSRVYSRLYPEVDQDAQTNTLRPDACGSVVFDSGKKLTAAVNTLAASLRPGVPSIA